MLAVNCANAVPAVNKTIENIQIEHRDIMLRGMESLHRGRLEWRENVYFKRVMYKYYDPRLSRTFFQLLPYRNTPSLSVSRFLGPQVLLDSLTNGSNLGPAQLLNLPEP